MKSRSRFVSLIILFAIAPSINYFITGEAFHNTLIRSFLVGISVAIAALIFFAQFYKNKPKEPVK